MSKIPIILVLLCATGTFVQCDSSNSSQIIAKANGDVFKEVADFLRVDGVGGSGGKFKDYIQYLTDDDVLAMNFRIQLIMMAYGVSVEQLPHYNHKKFYSIAASTAKMCGKLNVMERCFDIVHDVSLGTANSYLSLGTLKALKDFPEVWKNFSNSIQTIIDENPILFAVYTKIEQNLPFIKYTEWKAGGDNEALLNKTRVHLFEFMLHKMFVHHSYVTIMTKSRAEYYFTARSILILAKEPDKLETLQEIYDKVISEVALLCLNNSTNLYPFDDEIKIMFTKLAEKIGHDSSLKHEYADTEMIVKISMYWTSRSWILDPFVNFLPF